MVRNTVPAATASKSTDEDGRTAEEGLGKPIDTTAPIDLSGSGANAFSCSSVRPKEQLVLEIESGAFCIPHATDKKPDTVLEFAYEGWDEIWEREHRVMRWLEERANDKTAARIEFKSSVEGAGSVFHGFRETAGRMNDVLGVPLTLVQYVAWLQSIEGALQEDADWLTWTTAVVGIVPVVGNLMGFLDGAVHGNWGELALSGVGLLMVLAGESVPVLGEILDIALGLYQIGSMLWNLFKTLFDGEFREVEKMRAKITSAWKKAILTQCDPEVYPPEDSGQYPKNPIVPKMEEAWRRYEQGLLSSFATTLAMIDLKAEQIKNDQRSKLPEDKKKFEDETLSLKDRLWAQFGRFLADQATIFQAQMQITLRQLLTDKTAYAAFVDYFVSQYAEQEYRADLSFCQKDPDSIRRGVNCKEVAKTTRDLLLAAGAEIKEAGPPDPPDEVYALFDRAGRFFPRVLSPDVFPVPHITAVDIPSDAGSSTTLHWLAPKTLPRALISKCVFEVWQYDDHDYPHKSWASAAQESVRTAGDFRSTRQGRQWHQAWFGSPDLSKNYPPPADKNLPIDQQTWSPAAEYTYKKTGGLLDWWESDLSKIPHNYGHGSLNGQYVIVCDETGLAAGVPDTAIPNIVPNGLKVEQNPLSRALYQVWETHSNGPTADDPQSWSTSAIVNAHSKLNLDVDENGKIVQQLGIMNQPLWRASVAPGAPDAFTVASAERPNLVVTSGYNYVGMGDKQLLASPRKPEADVFVNEQRWRFIPTDTVLPVPGRFYTIVSDWNGLAVDLHDPAVPELRVPDQLSPTQLFQVKHTVPLLADIGISLWNSLHRQSLGFGSERAFCLRYIGGGAWKIIGQVAGKALDIREQTRAPSELSLATDTESPSQAWRLVEVPVRDPADDTTVATYIFTSVPTGLSATAAKDGGSIQLQPFIGQPLQLWTARNSGNEGYDTIGSATGKLAIKDPFQDGSPALSQDPAKTTAASEWQLLPTPSGAWVIRNKASGKVLDLAKTGSLGTTLTQHDYNGNPNQLWSITPVPPVIPTGRPIALYPLMTGVLSTASQSSAAPGSSRAGNGGWVYWDWDIQTDKENEDVLYIQDHWTQAGGDKAFRPLKAFRPNPERYPNLYLVPEPFMKSPDDKPLSGKDDRLSTPEQKTRWLRDVTGLLEKIDSCGVDSPDSGRALLESVGRNVRLLPGELAVEFGQWCPGDGYYTPCDYLGEPLPDRRPVGISLIMGASPAKIRAGSVSFTTSSHLLGQGGRAIIAFDPRITFRRAPHYDLWGTLQSPGDLMSPGQILVHEIIHQDLCLKGISFSAGEGYAITEKNPYRDVPGGSQVPRNVPPEEASVTTGNGRKKANRTASQTDPLITCDKAERQLRLYQRGILTSIDKHIPDAGTREDAKAFINGQVDERIKQQKKTTFVEEAISRDFLRNEGLSSEDAENRIRGQYFDLAADNNGNGSTWHYEMDDPFDLTEAAATKFIEVGECG